LMRSLISEALMDMLLSLPNQYGRGPYGLKAGITVARGARGAQ